MKKLFMLSIGAFSLICLIIPVYDFGLHYLADEKAREANQHEIRALHTSDTTEKKAAEIAMNECLTKSKEYKSKQIYFRSAE